MTKKGRQFLSKKKIGVTPIVATPDDNNPSDANDIKDRLTGSI